MSFLDDLSEGVKNTASRVSGLLNGEKSETWKMFDHYLGETGKDYNYSIPVLRNTKTIRDGEKLNQDRLLDALSKPVLKKKKFQSLVTKEYQSGFYSLNDMRDGEVFGLDDYNDVDSSKSEILDKSDYDLFGSLGSFKLRSKSNLQFMKNRGRILPYGDVEHSISDLYDFHPESDVISAVARKMEDLNIAKRFPVKAQWKTQPFGIITLNDGKVDRSGVEWNLLK